MPPTDTQQAPVYNGPGKRVKVYELKNSDWHDRGTGFCTGEFGNAGIGGDGSGHGDGHDGGSNGPSDARLVVISEMDHNHTLLDTRITKDDGYQKQQETLIVWTEGNGIDMALSFQEADGCQAIWSFVSETTSQLEAMGPDDALSDDLLDHVQPIVLPEPELGRLAEIENSIRMAASTHAGRDALSKFVMHPEQVYLLKLAPLVDEAERAQSLPDLHRLCTIMKHLILLNDTAIIEFVVTDQAIMGVVGALEYDPDFPSHKANHRKYLSDASKFKEVVPIQDEEIRRKIHWTHRLLYMKDVVLARILDDPTFSVLNSLIFFHQVDIVGHLQSNHEFLSELFAIFSSQEADMVRRKEAVLFIQSCCAVSKSIQAQSRAQLYHNLVDYGLFEVITFALRHQDAAVRIAGTDVLVSLIDHEPQTVRAHSFNALKEKRTPLIDTLIELLLVEVDLGVKSQVADAIKILLDPASGSAHMEMMNRAANAEAMAKQQQQPNMTASPQQQLQQQQQQQATQQTAQFIDAFYESEAKRLFAPLKALEKRKGVESLTIQETSLFTHLVDILCFFVKQHAYKSRLFILSENLHACIAKLLSCPQKFIKLTALKWFRACVGLHDEFHNRQLIQNNLLEAVLRVVEETLPRDNLLNSACLEFFEHIREEKLRMLITHLVEKFRSRLLAIDYVSTFRELVEDYEVRPADFPSTLNGGVTEASFTSQESNTPQRMSEATVPSQQHHHQQANFAGLKDMDHDEEAYFSTMDDDDDEDDAGLPPAVKNPPNGASPARPLVNYPDDEDEEMGLLSSSPEPSLRDKFVHQGGLDASVSLAADDDLQTSPDLTSTPEKTSTTTETTSAAQAINQTTRQTRKHPSTTTETNPAKKRRRSSSGMTAERERAGFRPSPAPRRSSHDATEEEGESDELSRLMAPSSHQASTSGPQSTTQIPSTAVPSNAAQVRDDEGQRHDPPLQDADFQRGDDQAQAHPKPMLRRKGSLRKQHDPLAAVSVSSGKWSVMPFVDGAASPLQGGRPGEVVGDGYEDTGRGGES